MIDHDVQRELEELFGIPYAAKWGVSDFYDEPREGLLIALGSGSDFDTGWYGVKKEIQQGRVVRSDETIFVSARVTDDLDQEGEAVRRINIPEKLDEIMRSGVPFGEWMLTEIVSQLDEACDDAERDQKENSIYIGWAIGPVAPDGNIARWLYSYIQPTGDGYMHDAPPGDYYDNWGWEDCRGTDDEEIPARTKEVFEAFIQSHSQQDAMTFRGWQCRKWGTRNV
jgi:hypothetical protein